MITFATWSRRNEARAGQNLRDAASGTHPSHALAGLHTGELFLGERGRTSARDRPSRRRLAPRHANPRCRGNFRRGARRRYRRHARLVCRRPCSVDHRALEEPLRDNFLASRYTAIDDATLDREDVARLERLVAAAATTYAGSDVSPRNLRRVHRRTNCGCVPALRSRYWRRASARTSSERMMSSLCVGIASPELRARSALTTFAPTVARGDMPDAPSAGEPR